MGEQFFFGMTGSPEHVDMLRNIGVKWIHTFAPLPPADEDSNALERFHASVQRIRTLRDQGFGICVATPAPHRSKQGEETPVDNAYYDRYRGACGKLAGELAASR